ncbi:MAG: acyltransferase [Paludibacter sp.]|jgi:peptidoglycan/LPS O-acetylase OafA/YrhL|nr:acyltransferase [Paludibacter sp.]
MKLTKNNETFSPQISNENSFDFLRLFFAFSVFVAHFGVVTSYKIYFPVSATMAVAGFFIISGFLITRSYYRSKNLIDFSLKRIRRIVPAYFLVVILCAVLLFFVSSLSFGDYFMSKHFFKYLIANSLFVNFVEPTLPGVFTENFCPQLVNGSLWTIKVELALYATVPFIAILLKKKKLLALLGIYLLSFVFSYTMFWIAEKYNNELFIMLQRQFVGQLKFFISGVILLFYFDFIIEKYDKIFFPVAAIIFLLRYFVSFWVIEFFYPIAFAIIIVWCAYKFKKLAIFTRAGDFSYGFYLFHFPIIQIFMYLGWFKDSPVLLFIVCFLTVYCLSGISWHLLEKRILRRKPTNLS